MTVWLAEYGLFLAKMATFFGLLVAAAAAIFSLSRKTPPADGLKVDHLNRKLQNLADRLLREVESKESFKQYQKQKKKADKKSAKKDTGGKPKIFVIDFKGDIRASATESLRQEVTAILRVAGEGDRVLVRLENPGGTVHEHGLAASQLLRITQKDIPLTVAVDKVAASGGYLMACVADEIIAAPFAIIGSIGVIAQLPNFNRLLKEHGVDFEQVTAGRYKRTLTLFGENTPEDREKLREELEEVHELFQAQVRQQRPQVDLSKVATGEHWYGSQAIDLNLVDRLGTSDDFLIESMDSYEIYAVSFKRKRPWLERVMGNVESALAR